MKKKKRIRKSERQTQRGSVRNRKKQREREQKLRQTLKGTQKELGEWGHRNFKRQKQTHTIRMRKRGELEKGRKKN